MYPSSLILSDILVQQALQIAMNYLKQTGQAENYREVERLASRVILEATQQGSHNRILLANKAIAAIERRQKVDEDLGSLYPRVC